MNELGVFDLYRRADPIKKEAFSQKIASTLNVKTNYDKIECNFEWLDLMEDTIIYLDNILRNPNRFIVNNEEIVKVELARKITVESIKHLSKNTNLIQDFDKKTGDVRPSKILNILKDEDYNTYENRLIYTLINNMRAFVSLKKRDLMTDSSLKDTKTLDYKATTKIGKEKVDINLMINSKIQDKKNDGKRNGKSIPERIETLELKISDLTNSEVYKTLHKAHVAAVTPPIKKTNVILKNVNFQYAMTLWDYLQTHIQDENKRVKENKNYEDKGELKQYFDDTSLLNYITISTLNNEPMEDLGLSKEETEQITDKLIDKIVELNVNMDETELEEMIGTKIVIAKRNNMASLSEIRKAFSASIDEYLNRIKQFKF